MGNIPIWETTIIESFIEQGFYQYGIVEYERVQILRITEKLVHNYYVNVSIYVLSPEVVDSIDKEEFQDMPDVFSQLIAKRDKAVLYPIEDYWLYIGYPGDFELAQAEWNNI